MAEAVNTNSNEQPKKGRPANRMPRIDMTPMVDLAFLLLTFFVLTSCLNKPKTMEMVVPADPGIMPVYEGIAHTILLDGSKDKIYYFSGMLSDETQLQEIAMGEELRKLIGEINSGIAADMAYLDTVFASGKFASDDYAKLDAILKAATTSNTDPEAVANLKAENYSECIGLMKTDLDAGVMSDATHKKIGSVIRSCDEAPFFIIKWGNDAMYGDVIDVIDELKIGHVSKYALTKISEAELRALSKQTGKEYPELQNK